MKILLLLIIIIIIYLIAKKIKVVHLENVPSKEKKELENRHRIRSLLLSNYIRCHQNDHLPSINDFLKYVKKYYLDHNYVFNSANLPVSLGIVGDNLKNAIYQKYILENIKEWSELFEDQFISVNGIKIYSVRETQSEFLVKAHVSLLYNKEDLYLELTYYGKIGEPQDFFKDLHSKYIIQLININRINRSQYLILNTNKDIFPKLSDQMKYVEYINQIHQKELFD